MGIWRSSILLVSGTKSGSRRRRCTGIIRANHQGHEDAALIPFSMRNVDAVFALLLASEYLPLAFVESDQSRARRSCEGERQNAYGATMQLARIATVYIMPSSGPVIELQRRAAAGIFQVKIRGYSATRRTISSKS